MLDAITINFNGSCDTLELVDSFLSNYTGQVNLIIIDNKSEENDLLHLTKCLANKCDFVNVVDTNISRIKKTLYFKATEKINIYLVHSENNYGFSGGNNLGISVAQTLFNDFEFHNILFVNNDVVIPCGALEKCITVMENSLPDIALSPSILNFNNNDLIWFDSGNFVKWKANSYHSNIGKKYDSTISSLSTDFLCGCFVLHSAKLIKQYNISWDEEFFLYCEDLDYSLQLRKLNVRLIIIPSIYVYHKISKTSNKTPILQYYYTNRNRFLIIRKWLPNKYYISLVLYITIIRLSQALLSRNRGYLAGILDGVFGRFGKAKRCFL